MRVVFRVDASYEVGSGHLMRCLTLAKHFIKEKKADVYFIMRALDGNLINLVEQEGIHSLILPKADKVYHLEGYSKWLTVSQVLDAEQSIKKIEFIDSVDLLVVDSYAIDITWECMLRPYTKKIMVIDDLANRKHDCDILLDQNLYDDMYKRYNGLIPSDCECFLGPSFVLLRDEFYIAREKLSRKRSELRNILVFFGGIDASNETTKTLQAIDKLNKPDLIVNVVVGKNNPYKEEVANYCAMHDNWNYYCQINNMAELMVDADLAIGAGGTTTWERCFLNLPSIVITVADNQVEGAMVSSKEGIIKYLGLSRNVNVEAITQAIGTLSLNEIELMSKRCNYLMDDGGQIYEMLEICCTY